MPKPKKADNKRQGSDVVVLKKNAVEIEKPHPMDKISLPVIEDMFISSFPPMPPMISPIHETSQESLDSHMENPSPFSESPRVENQKNTSPIQDSGFGSGISASEFTDSETSSNASFGKIIHHQIPNQSTQESLQRNFSLDSHLENPSIFSESTRVQNQKNTSPIEDSGFGTEISASESTDSETSSNASLGNGIHHQISNQSKEAQDSGAHENKTQEAEKVKIFNDHFSVILSSFSSFLNLVTQKFSKLYLLTNISSNF